MNKASLNRSLVPQPTFSVPAPTGLPNPPQTLKGFENIRRHRDIKTGIWVAEIMPGGFYVTKHHERISTVLGSCVAACIRDPITGIGGMNHFMLPEVPGDQNESALAATCYGDNAMESLINSILNNGGRRENLEIKLFGGGNVIRSATGDIGRRNYEFALDYIRMEGLRLLAQDLGDIYPRRLLYYPMNGDAYVLKVGENQAQQVLSQEKRYREQIKVPIKTDIEFF